jgi:hypothetical protein
MRLLGIALTGTLLHGAGWPSFRGENGSGLAEAVNLPIEFSREKNLV